MIRRNASLSRLSYGVFECALDDYSSIQKRRVRAMYNRHRALFAEHIVAALLPSARVVENPSAACYVSWQTGRLTVRVQVKCSGEILPMHPAATPEARWPLRGPRQDFEPHTYRRLAPGHHCDLFVLARHSGKRIESDCTLAAVRQEEVVGWSSVTVRRLDRLGRSMVVPLDLAGEARPVLRVSHRPR